MTSSKQMIKLLKKTEGDDIILKHPMIFKTAELAVINKVDTAHAVDVDTQKMKEDILSLNPNVPVILTSKHDWRSLENWIGFIEQGLKETQKIR